MLQLSMDELGEKLQKLYVLERKQRRWKFGKRVNVYYEEVTLLYNAESKKRVTRKVTELGINKLILTN